MKYLYTCFQGSKLLEYASSDLKLGCIVEQTPGGGSTTPSPTAGICHCCNPFAVSNFLNSLDSISTIISAIKYSFHEWNECLLDSKGPCTGKKANRPIIPFTEECLIDRNARQEATLCVLPNISVAFESLKILLPSFWEPSEPYKNQALPHPASSPQAQLKMRSNKCTSHQGQKYILCCCLFY